MDFVSSIFLSAASMFRGRTVLYQRIEGHSLVVMVDWCRLISFVIFVVYPLLDIGKFGSRKISFLCNLLLGYKNVFWL